MGPDPKAVRGIAVCAGCGYSTFTIKIYSCGNHRAHCQHCNQAWEEGWETEDRGESDDVEGNAAVA